MIRRSIPMFLFVLVLSLTAGCSDDDGGGAAVGNEPRTLEEALDQAAEESGGRLTEITEPEGDGPVIGVEDGEEVRVSDAQVFCDGYWRVADYRDQIFNLIDRGERDLLSTYVEGTGPSAEQAASDLKLGVSGGMDFDMRPWVFVVDSQEWIRRGVDLETISERAAARNAELEGFDRVYDEIC